MDGNEDQKQKILLENRKLELEIQRLGRPFYLQPGAWIGFVTAIAALFGIVIQYFLSTHQYQLAEIKAERAVQIEKKAKDEEKKAKAGKEEAEKARDKALKELKTLRAKLETERGELEQTVKTKEELKQEIFEAQRTKENLVHLIADLTRKAAPVVPTENVVTLSGRITDSEGTPLGNVQVDAYEGNKLIASTTTASNGAYVVKANRGSFVRFVVRREGFAIYARDLHAKSDEVWDIRIMSLEAVRLK